jgi:hypothetical protein
MSDVSFDVNAFIQESKSVLTNPKAYFSTMKTSGGMTEPIIKAVIYGAIAGAFSFLWSILKLGVVSGGILGGAFGVMAFIWSIIGAVIGLFIGAVILLVISSICKGNTDYEANVRVTAACMVIMPVSAFFGFADHLNVYLGTIISIAISLYSIWLLYNGLVEALRANPETSRIVSYVLVGLVVVFTLIGFGARKRANEFMRDFNNRDVSGITIENTHV